jgi:UDP-2,3-diacylglucosamine hydrolase
MTEKIYFASDFHLGADARLPSRERERQVVRWLEQAAPDATQVYLVGDLFEAWFEYKAVVPKGFTRFLGCLARLRDAGLPIEVWTGNHDVWMFGYFEQELGIRVHKGPLRVATQHKNILIGHGDGLGPNDYGYKRMKKVLTNPTCQWLFRQVHPDLGQRVMYAASHRSRTTTPPEESQWLGEEHEWLYRYTERKVAQGADEDFFVFGHRHLPIDWLLSNGRSRYINLGEWMWACSYAVFDGTDMEVRFFENPTGEVVRNW